MHLELVVPALLPVRLTNSVAVPPPPCATVIVVLDKLSVWVPRRVIVSVIGIV